MSKFVDHLVVPVADLGASRAFYEQALAPLGARVEESDDGVAFGTPDNEDFIIVPGGPVAPLHVAFAATSRDQVQAFWEAALAAGGGDNGPPGPRPVYHAGYYAAFVLDPDGHNAEAVFHGDHAPARVRPIEEADRETLVERARAVWGELVMWAHGEPMDPAELPGFLAESDGEAVGTVTYVVRGEKAEIATIESDRRLPGTGTALLEAAVAAARAAGARRMVVTTTNDNLRALRFYQRRGFRLSRLLPGAVDEPRRRLKPQIPELGDHGIPLSDELELTMEL